MRPLVIRGGGLAGTSAALAALQRGAAVHLIEKSRFPRHKVCGEFLSAEALPLLEKLGVRLPESALIRRVRLCFERAEKQFALPEQAAGISRYLLDRCLLEAAADRGAMVSSEGPSPDILAHGRQLPSVRGQRAFGFKAHFRGPSDDYVSLFFLPDGYVGVNPVEGGITNVCGILPEEWLRDLDARLRGFRPLAERLEGMEQVFPWLRVGPLVYRANWDQTGPIRAGDALNFVDPFSGSGMLTAIRTGALAGHFGAESDTQGYYRQCKRLISSPVGFCSIIRTLIHTKLAELLVGLIPGRLLYYLSRPVR
jgi:flavin-dependent dehydrogenase